MSQWTKEYLALCQEHNAVNEAIRTIKFDINSHSRLGEPIGELQYALDSFKQRKTEILSEMSEMRTDLRHGNKPPQPERSGCPNCGVDHHPLDGCD